MATKNPSSGHAQDALQASTILVVLMVITDFAFYGLFGALKIGLVTDGGFWATADRSYAEVFQYIKFFWIVLLMLMLAWRRMSVLHVIFAGVFGFMMVDDYAGLHEQWGEQLGVYLQLSDWLLLESHDFGELIVFGLYGVVTLSLLAVGYFLAGVVDRAVMWDLVWFLSFFALFAVGVDLLHAMALPEWINNPLSVLEDGGEMVVASLIVWRVLQHTTRSQLAEEQWLQSASRFFQALAGIRLGTPRQAAPTC